ncbi:hypothetical protein [Halosolutus gelatinilyticus]|uniref:hypothetical protein n=1 Tax=Halosolutus gelatinilyticus TaxID=2931975 RepID=UPI001FF1A5CE|nr:hypothetical protein [Halosolutus gelatinilyticus]
MATIAYEAPDGTAEESVDADNITDSGKVQGIRVNLEGEGYIHLPYARIYWIRTSEDEGKVDYSSA